MNPDLYTKTVLTIIAACLVWMCVNGATPTAWAQAAQAPQAPQVTRVLLVDQNNVPVPTAQGLRVNFGPQAVPVTVEDRSVAVTVTGIERRGSWHPLEVHVLREPPTLRPTP
jgi:hypothetical protein